MKRIYGKILLYAVIVISVVVVVAMLLGPFVIWKFMPSTQLNVWIVDKTVPMPDYREHKGLMWILNHNKILFSKTENSFLFDKDYFGFFPVNNEEYDIRAIPTMKEDPDLIYITDTYGVYTDDYLVKNVKGTRSDLIYGGLTKEELVAIKNNLGKANTLIGEFNIASAPTNAENRLELEELFGIKWVGWKGRYFNELTRDVEVPVWVVENYESQSQKKWDFKGSGYILVSDSDMIEVLENKKDVGKKGLQIVFSEEYAKEFNIKSQIPYQYWFEFIKPNPGKEILSNYHLDLTDEGEKRMQALGLSSEFPAMVRFINTQYTSYYFAGDYADMANTSSLWQFYGYEKIKRLESSFNKYSLENFYWNCYVPVMNKVLKDIPLKKEQNQKKLSDQQAFLVTAKAENKKLQILKNGKWEEIFVKGVNIGAALPGKWFTEFPTDEAIYYEWFEKIGQMNSNTIRVYTLLPPSFYHALAYYNKMHPENILWLLQEIWPEENPKEHDYLQKSYVEDYFKEIVYTIDAMHGNANILERKGRAYGIYTSDVSPYILGYLVGRELEPDEVIATNERNKGFTYAGEYISSEITASASEAWLAMNCDYVLKHESTFYQNQHPVAIVSWPTLDVTEHDSEWNEKKLKSLVYNDKVSIDINHLISHSINQAGLFGAYHIYPNYPDFMNNESKYDSYKDAEGRFRYGGYLKEFMEKHTRYPALVAEFGLATGMENAHYSPDGYHHGGMTEQQQGNGILRMMKAMQKENYAGGLIFEWIDEWAKKTWTTEPYMIPYERHVFWHNVIDPEQNYGLQAMESPPPQTLEYSVDGNQKIKKISLGQNASYLYIDITLNSKPDFKAEEFFVGIDTFDRTRGEFKFSPNIDAAAPSGLEFLLDLSGTEDSRILVHPGYNIAKGKFSTYASSLGIFEEMRPLINAAMVTKDNQKIKEVIYDGSHLVYGDFMNNSHNHFYLEGNIIHIRIPWGKLNFSDPSELTVLDDARIMNSPLRDEIKTFKSDGIFVSVLSVDTKSQKTVDMLNTTQPYQWKNWTDVSFIQRLKSSYDLIKEYFGTID